jgi:hypothetical protein
MWTVGTVSEPRIGSVRLDTQKPRVNELVEHPLQQGPLDTAEPLRLFTGQAQTRHLQKLGTNTFEQSVVRHDDVHAAFERRVSRRSRSAFNQSSTSCPCSQPRAR